MAGLGRATSLTFAGLAAGALVGAGDGVRAALLIGADAGGAAAAAALTAGADALVGAVVFGALGGFVAVGRWGRSRARPAPWAHVLAWVGLGLGVGLAGALAVVATAQRRNRLLAGGVVAMAVTLAGVVAVILAPAFMRLLSRRGDGRAPTLSRLSSVAPNTTGAAQAVLVPLVFGVIDMAVCWTVMRARPPLLAAALRETMAIVVAVSLSLLPLVALAGRVRWSVDRRRVHALSATVVAIAATAFTVANWSNHMRFLPWAHILVGAGLLIGGGLTFLIIDRAIARVWGRSLVAVSLAACAALALAAVVLSSRSEIARKAVAARAGLAGPVLEGLQRVLDFDGDGHARWVGGSDCDDGDPTVFPGALDFPEDGLDQDCDGVDASVAVLQPPLFGGIPASVPPDLNLLFITIDTVRADHLGCYGYPRQTSPAIDRLAVEGTLFENGWAHAPSTRYSMPAIATGRWPSAIHWDESIWWPRIAPDVKTVGQALKPLGYLTAAFFSYEYFSPADRRGFERGIDVYRADRAILHQAVNGPMESRGSSAREMADDAIAFLDGHRDRKFFLWLHFYDPHLSYEPHADVPSFGTGRQDLYDGEIRFTDMHVGRIVDRVKALGLWGKTAVFVTGDHGEGFGEHGVTEHGFHLYAPQTKVPLIARVPGLAPRSVRAPAGHVDLAPTFVHLARGRNDAASLGNALLGRSLVPEIAGATAATAPPPLFQEVTSERGKKRALVNERLHVIWNWTPENTTECYDLTRDPREERDLWGRADGVRAGCGEAKRQLQAWVSAVAAPPGQAAAVRGSVFGPGRTAPPPPIVAESNLGGKIRLLGYGIAPEALSTTGGDIEVSHHFSALAPLGDGWKFFFHLMGPGGSFRNLDHVPVEGAMPLERWRAGQTVIDRFRFTVPPGTPPGRYTIQMGIYRGGERLVVTPTDGTDGNRAVKTAGFDVR